MEKTGYTLSSGATSEGVVLNVAFAFSDAEAALEFEKTLGGKAKKGEKAKPEKAEKPAKGSKKAKDEEEDDDEDEEDDEEEEEEEEEESDDDDDDDEDEGEDDEDEKPKGKAKKGKDEEEGSSKVKLTPALKKATKLREVIVELMNQGLKGQKIVDACVALKSKLAVLKPIKDLETRVPRAVDLIKKK